MLACIPSYPTDPPPDDSLRLIELNENTEKISFYNDNTNLKKLKYKQQKQHKQKNQSLNSHKSCKINNHSKEFKDKINQFIGIKPKKVKPLFYQWSVNVYKNSKKINSVKCNPQLNKTLEIEYRKPLYEQSPIITSSNGFLSQKIIAEYNIQSKKLSIQEENKNLELSYKLKRNLTISGQIFKIPKNWCDIQSHTCQLFDIENSSEEFLNIQKSLLETLQTVKIISIKRVQNLLTLQKYNHEIHKLISNGININEKYLFHGTRNLYPGIIITSQEGFDTRLAGNQNLWGPGAYFAEDANYADRFAYRGSNASTRQLLIASVILGDCFNYGKLCNPALRQPPMNIETQQRFNSVSGITKNSKVYSVYNTAQSCPRYIVKYSVE